MMEVPEIIEAIRNATGKFALEAVEAAIARREEVTPALLAILEDVARPGAASNIAPDFIAPLYSAYLLSQFRETRAHPVMVRMALLPEEELEIIFGEDFVTSSLGSILASTCGGDLTGIKSIVEDEAVNPWARGAALDSLVTLFNCGRLSREEVVEYFRELFSGKLARTEENIELWSQLVANVDELYPEELLDEIEQAYEDDLVNQGFIGPADIARSMAAGRDKVLARLATNSTHNLINDTIKELGSWACFHEDESQSRGGYSSDLDDLDPFEEDEDLPDWYSNSTEYVVDRLGTAKRIEPKVGRNEPCPCGSGKKYKKCCGA